MLTEVQVEAVGAASNLPEETVMLLQMTPYKGSPSASVPTGPLIYRSYEFISVYDVAFEALIHGKFGGGIMSAIGFNMNLTCESNPKGDYVRIIMGDKLLPYKTY